MNQTANPTGFKDRIYNMNITNDALFILVANLVQELIDLGVDQYDIIWMLLQSGMTDKFIKDNYGLPFSNDVDGNE